MKLEVEKNPPLAHPTARHSGHVDLASITSDPGELLNYGVRSAQSGNRAEARTALLRVTETDPKNEAAWLWLASISEYPEELLVFLNNVLEINPDNQRAGEWKAATNSLLAKTFVQRGIDAAENDRKDFAAECFNRALEYEQTNEMAWLWMASLADSAEGKLNYLEMVLKINPSNEPASRAFEKAKREITTERLAAAKVAAVSGQKDEALGLVEAVIEDDPACEEAWLLRSHFSDTLEEKLLSFEKLISIDPENEAARVNLESLRKLTDNTEDAAQPEQRSTFLIGSPDVRFSYEPEIDRIPTQDLEIPPEIADQVRELKQRSVTLEPVHEPVSPENGSEPTSLEEVWSTTPKTLPVVEFDISLPDETVSVVEAELANEPFDCIAVDIRASEETDDMTIQVSPAEEYASPDTETAEFHVVEITETNSELGPDVVRNEIAASGENAHLGAEPSSNFKPASEENAQDIADHVIGPSDLSLLENIPAQVEFTSEQALTNNTKKAAQAENDDPYKTVTHNWLNGTVDSFDSIPDLNGLSKTAEEPFDPEVKIVEPTAPLSCSFCGSENERNAIRCNFCLAVLTISDLDLILGNQSADRSVIRKAVERMELEMQRRAFSEADLTMLGIGHLNLQSLQNGYNFLHEAAKLNPDNVILSSQVNSLLIRIEDVRKHDEMMESMARNKKILVVDDSPTVRKLIAGKLEKCGHAVSCAADGVEALDVLKGMKPDLVLLDINMPRMDGYQTCKAIRSMEEIATVPVIMISGKDGFFDKVRGKMAGTTAYITKPFGPETLMKIVEGILSGEAVEVPDTDTEE